jgi:hypothetical protein
VRYSVAEADLGKWASFSVTINDDGGNKVADLESGHYRVLRMQFGENDDGTPWALPTVPVNNVNQAQTLTYYIANLRWAK